MFHRQRIASLLKRQEQQRRAQHSLSPPSESANTTTVSPLSASETFLTIPELVLTVFNFLYTKDLPQACLVCSLWSALAQPLLWRHGIRLESDSQIQAFAAPIAICGAWVQSLDFNAKSDGEEDIPLSYIDLSNILRHTPQLRRIDVRERTMDEHPLMALAPCSQLESIAFTQYQDHVLDLGADGNRDIFSAWPQLKHLSISGTDWERPSAAAASLERALVVTKSLHLETINLAFLLSWSPLTVHHLVRTNADHLRHLNLATCHFIPQEFFEEILAGATHLESFGLRECLYIPERLPQIAQTHPRLKCLSLTDGVGFPADVVIQVARACPLLESLELDSCEDTVIAARQFLAHCPHLRTLILFPLEGPNVMDLFLGEPWFTLPESGAKVRHPDGNNANKSQHKKDRIQHDDGFYQLGALKRLKSLGVIGYSVWEFGDVEWMARSFPWLELFWYRRDDMAVPQLSWLCTHRPEIELSPYP
ncbi:hypothetical protein EC957_008722 [Mortierella hygrophila]|uniref:F-box domain-containing protein n=1 Tax=Mortierella hygrophila TaxID=979708 RepID=A0A9P6FBV1_9FUNG|nr:hypothetical protein EC957_008722 [Mortierella hygrophila]